MICGIREIPAPVFGYGIVSPKDGRFVSAGTHLYDRQAAMRQAVKLCTIYGGTGPRETWRHLYRQGYRIVRVRIATAFHASIRMPPIGSGQNLADAHSKNPPEAEHG